MKFIKPNEISSKIMTLIDESDEYVIIVSPYVNISRWYKFQKKLDKVKARNIPIQFVIRDDKTNQKSIEDLVKSRIKYSLIKDLHCKLYLNEKYAIVSSMNLHLYSEINSIELAYQTETEKELDELKEFCERYLHIEFNQSLSIENDMFLGLGDYIRKIVGESLGVNIRIQHDNGNIIVNTGSNNYSVFIWNSKHNMLRISGILSGKEYEYLDENPKMMPKIEGINITLQNGGDKFYNTIWGTLEIPLKSSNINYVYEKEKSLITQKLTEFIIEIDRFKKWITH